MRATYEGLLTVAHRRAVDSAGRVSTDPDQVAAGWAAVLAATRRQMAWLKYELEIPDVGQPAAHGDPALMAVAQPLGAAADLLAVQDAVTASVLDDRVSLVAARAAVANIASISARSALNAMTSVSRRRRTVEQRSLARHLRFARRELEPIVAQESNGPFLGALGGLAASMPAASTETYERIAHAAAHWQRLHEEIPAQSLLTRDLRSITAQVRTAAGHGRYLVRAVGASAQRLGFGGPAILRLRKANTALRRTDASAIRTTAAWNRHVSDLGGTTSLPGEFAFRELHEAVRGTVALPSGALRSTAELIPDRWTADAVLEAVDELVHSAHQVAVMQQRAVFDLVTAGRLFVSRSQAIRADPAYQQLTVAPIGRRQRSWVRVERIDFVPELTESLAAGVDLLGEAALACRQLAHTDVQRRPTRLESPTRIAGPDPKRRPRKAVAQRPDQPDPTPAVELP
ncbi:hypothetical protein BWI15_00175 [Kribbella sp. ALI-6-A]|uniref:hypothetical protein n=1 Tax=Kribbella sp. ALI-6-A TaxID=1933817 RepID=UPI00097C39A7|nr:hypothetical protein [Kribbella sp. ALI-6-A]ONI79096.1 hypothetical protein BWI15_00175 [Kribbella sp. ALI-6-A]